MRGLRHVVLVGTVSLTFAATGCGDDASERAATTPPPDPPSTDVPWIDEEVRFRFEGDELFGVLTLPAGRESPPAVVLVSGSGDELGLRDGSSTPFMVDHAHRLAEVGVAVLRYDPPGVGRSGGEAGLFSLERRSDETLAAVRYVAARPDIDGDAVGLLGWSQGPWVMAMTTARHPGEVAFLVSVVGSGATVAEQQVYGIEAQSRAAGLSEDDVAKAVLFGRLLIDGQLIEPVHREINDEVIAELGDGPWARFAELVYEPGDVDPVGAIPLVVELLREVADEPWADALHLQTLYIPLFESIPTDLTDDQLAAMQAVIDADLTRDPAESWTEVRVPVLAVFGELDPNVDSERSARRYEEYLAEAGNDDVTIVILPEVGHDIDLSTAGYWDLVSQWLLDRWARPDDPETP